MAFINVLAIRLRNTRDPLLYTYKIQYGLVGPDVGLLVAVKVTVVSVAEQPTVGPHDFVTVDSVTLVDADAVIVTLLMVTVQAVAVALERHALSDLVGFDGSPLEGLTCGGVVPVGLGPSSLLLSVLSLFLLSSVWSSFVLSSLPCFSPPPQPRIRPSIPQPPPPEMPPPSESSIPPGGGPGRGIGILGTPFGSAQPLPPGYITMGTVVECPPSV